MGKSNLKQESRIKWEQDLISFFLVFSPRVYRNNREGVNSSKQFGLMCKRCRVINLNEPMSLIEGLSISRVLGDEITSPKEILAQSWPNDSNSPVGIQGEDSLRKNEVNPRELKMYLQTYRSKYCLYNHFYGHDETRHVAYPCACLIPPSTPWVL